MGRKPVPTAQLERRGSWRAKERADEPAPNLPEDISPPEDLPTAALELWRSLAPTLKNAGILTDADLPTLEQYVRTFIQWRRVMSAIEQADEVERTDVLTLAKLDDRLGKLGARLGLSPTDRVGMEVSESSDDGKGRFFD